jgi:uncharacterized protein (DUF849 family)
VLNRRGLVMLIKACLNGSRARGAHPALPLTPEELAREARSAVEASAGALHIHPYRADGAQSLEAGDVAAAVAAIRAACPGVPVGVTTIALAAPDPARRLALVRSWTRLPDFASVNFAEAGAADLCTALLDMGVGVEPGLATAADAQLLIDSALADRYLRLLLEPEEQDLDAALATVVAIEAALDAGGVQTPRLLHGIEATAWPLLDVALDRGYDLRIGLEDTLLLPDGQPAAGNAQLVVAARERAARVGRL